MFYSCYCVASKNFTLYNSRLLELLWRVEGWMCLKRPFSNLWVDVNLIYNWFLIILDGLDIDVLRSGWCPRHVVLHLQGLSLAHSEPTVSKDSPHISCQPLQKSGSAWLHQCLSGTCILFILYPTHFRTIFAISPKALVLKGLCSCNELNLFNK